MILGDKISALRRSNGMSQEELAERLDVSRQSVSKWESGNSIPDMNKILKLSEVFGVSTDYLLKDDVEEDHTVVVDKSTSSDAHVVTLEEANSYMDTVRGVVAKQTLGIALCIMSPVVLLALAGYSELKGGAYEEMLAGIGVAILLVFVAIGVMMIVSSAMKTSKFEHLEKEALTLDYGVKGVVEKRRAAFEDTHRRNIVVGIALCIVACVPLIILATMKVEDCIVAMSVSLLLIIVAIGVYKIAWAATIEETHEVLLQIGEYAEEEKKVTNKIQWFPGAYWLTVVAVYLAVSLATNGWDKTYVIWPVAALLFAAVKHILRGIIKSNL